MEPVKIPIIILNWNGLADTIECIASLGKMNRHPYEIILVDNGSEPHEQAEIARLYDNRSDIRLILNEENKGFTRGNSDIVADIMTQSEIPRYVILLNNDTAVTSGWLSALVSSADKNQGDVVSSRMINYFDRSRIDNVGHFMLNTGEILPRGHMRPIEEYEALIDNLGACGGAALYRTAMIRSIGFFDPFFDTGYEDAEYGLRAKLLGYRCFMEPRAIVYHKVSQSIVKIRNNRYVQRIQINILYTYIKLMPRLFLWINLPFMLLKYTMWFLLGILTLQFRMINLHSGTVARFVSGDLRKALQARRQFYAHDGYRIRHRNKILYPTEFFVKTDIRRAWLRARAFWTRGTS